VQRRKIVSVVGARPNFVKIAPLLAEFSKHPDICSVLVHTGQHYGHSMDRLFFDQLQIPTPDVNLEVGSASHAVQTARIMERFEPVLLEHAPDLVLVVGDVNSTLACALVTIKAGIPVGHIEAGLRSFDRSMPEEINRILTDAISEYLFVTEHSGLTNLRREGISDRHVYLVGNLMMDTLIRQLGSIGDSPILDRLALHERRYALVTLHRPSNVDDPASLRRLYSMLLTMAERIPVVFPAHPRTVKNLQALGLSDGATRRGGLMLIEPLGYVDFLALVKSARLVLTDSGGIQEETTFLQVPCLTLRANTERPITVEVGTNRLVGNDPDAALRAFRSVLDERFGSAPAQIPEMWDGRTAERITKILRDALADRERTPASAPVRYAA